MRISIRYLVPALVLASGSFAHSQNAAAGADDEAVLQQADKIERAFISLAARVQRSTVSVLNYQWVAPKNGGDGGANSPKVERVVSVGSGFVTSNDGRIFTNVHVVRGNSRLEVVLHDGRVLPVTEHSEVTSYDFALLLSKCTDVTPAEWAKSNLIQPGQFVIAAGNPRALAMKGHPVVTLGIVSGLHRRAEDPTFPYENAIQTDAEINPGNSGGPLFDTNGRIIGINGKIATTTNALTNVGVGFTIPARQVQNFMKALNEGGMIEPGFHGLVLADGAGPDDGVLVKAVVAGSPAAKAGMKDGDRIVALNGEKVTPSTFENKASMLPGGSELSLTFYRKDKVSVKTFTSEKRTKPLPK